MPSLLFETSPSVTHQHPNQCPPAVTHQHPNQCPPAATHQHPNQGRLVHKGDWGDALPRKKKKKLLMYKRNILASRVNDDVNLNVIICFLSDSTTRPSDLPLYVIVESGNSHSVSLKSCFKWPRPFWSDLGRNENHPRPLPLTPVLNPFISQNRALNAFSMASGRARPSMSFHK